jgi:DNA polymerase I-like protein with 3'-5' exonuclease and polymerase domains
MANRIDPELALRMVRESPLIAFDTETSGLTVKDFICGYVVTDSDNSIYVPVRHEGGGNIPNSEEFDHAIATAFEERTRMGFHTVGHHLGFDLRAALRHGIRITGSCEDTMINESLCNDLTMGYGLDDCAPRWGVQAKKGAEIYQLLASRFGGLPDKKQMGKFHKLEGDNSIVVDYATGDGVSTLQLREAQQKKIDEMGLRKVWKLECDLLPYLARMHNRGMLIDMEYADKVNADIAAAIAEMNKKFSPGFNARSGKEVEALYRANGYTDSMFNRTEKGAPSFTEGWLENNEIGDAILSVRRLEKARDAFVAPLIDTNNLNGRVHPILHQSKSDDYGVAGARLSCSEPNLQAIPKRRIEIGRIVRRLVIPDPGMLIEEADAKQQEPRLFTHYSEDSALVHGYTTGEFDMHDRANEVLGLNDREKAKRLGMGMLTMMSVRTLSVHMRCKYEEAEILHNLFLHSAFPAIREFQNTAVSVYRRRGYVRSILGRVAHCDSPKFGYRAVSRIVQNSGGDHIKTCMLRACQFEDAHPDKIQMLLSIHDSMLWQRQPDFDTSELVRILENVANEFKLKVPIPFGLGGGTDWAQASYGSKLDQFDD